MRACVDAHMFFAHTWIWMGTDGHNYIGHNYFLENTDGHNYIGHNYICHNNFLEDTDEELGMRAASPGSLWAPGSISSELASVRYWIHHTHQSILPSSHRCTYMHALVWALCVRAYARSHTCAHMASRAQASAEYTSYVPRVSGRQRRAAHTWARWW